MPARYSGVALALQIGVRCAGFTPLLATALVGSNKSNWLPAAWIVAASSIIAALGAFWLGRPTTYRLPSSATRCTTGRRGGVTVENVRTL